MPRPFGRGWISANGYRDVCGPEKFVLKKSDGWVWVGYVHPLTTCQWYLGCVPQEEWDRLNCCLRWEKCMSFLRKVMERAENPASVSEGILRDLLPRFPALHEYMTATRFPDGRERVVSTLMLVVDPDGLKGCLNDRQTGYQLWVAADTVEGLFSALEGSLTASQPNWRKSKYGPQGAQKKGR